MKKFLTFVGILVAVILAGFLVGQYAFAAPFPVAVGGTGASTLTGCLTGNGTNPITGSGSCATFAFPFTPTTNFAVNVNATSTPIWFQSGIMASTTSYFGPAGSGLSIDGTTGQLNTQNVVVGSNKTIQFTGYSSLPQLYAGDSTTGIHFDGPGILSTHGSGIQQSILTSIGRWGFGATSSPYAKFAIQSYATESNTTLFVIASSTANSTTTLFSVSNIGTTTLGRFGTCNTTNALTTDASGNITCGAITGSGSAYPFTPSTDGGINTSATSTPIQGTHPGLGLDVSNTSWYGIGGQLIAYASTTNGVTVFGLQAGGTAATTSNALRYMTALGFQALSASSGGAQNTAVGAQALLADTTGSNNTAMGAGTLNVLTTGTGNTGIGVGTLQGVISNNYNTAIGFNAGNQVTGYGNILVGASVTNNNLTSGNGNVGLGNELFFPSATGNNQLNIGNLIFGTLPATTTSFTTPSSGSVGIASSTPFSTLSVGTGAASSSITVAEYKYGATGNVATSTAANIDCNASTQIAWPLGTSATTLTLINLTPGKKCIVVVQNPTNGTAGAITWAVQSGFQLYWAGGAAPTQTTTTNKQDVWSFLVTQASSTKAVLGAMTANF